MILRAVQSCRLLSVHRITSFLKCVPHPVVLNPPACLFTTNQWSALKSSSNYCHLHGPIHLLTWHLPHLPNGFTKFHPVPERSGLASIYPSNSSWPSSWSTCSSLKDQQPHIQWHSVTTQDSAILHTLRPAYTAHILHHMLQLCTATFREMNLILSFTYNSG